MIFLLAVSPCTESEGFFTQKENPLGEKQNDCSVFCICLCSGMALTSPSSVGDSFSNINDELLFHHTYIFIYAFLHSFEVWRPPMYS